MTANPINKSVLNFEDDFIRESYCKVINQICNNHRNFLPYLHFDVLPSQKLMIKIQKWNDSGSLKDLLYKSNAMNNYSKKYPNNKAKGLHLSQIASFGRQILEALLYLHSNRWYHMHLHSGNILIDEEEVNSQINLQKNNDTKN